MLLLGFGISKIEIFLASSFFIGKFHSIIRERFTIHNVL
jgi:hypothetical protein